MKKKTQNKSKRTKPIQIQLPKDALARVDIGQAFAEYDLVRDNFSAFVKTPAIDAALDESHAKCFFVGRRGTGKTAINYFVAHRNKRAVQVIPQIFDLVDLPMSLGDFSDTRQRPFKSLVNCFKRAIFHEVISSWVGHGKFSYSKKFPIINRERNFIEGFDFDLGVLSFIEVIFKLLLSGKQKDWYREINRVRNLSEEMLATGIDSTAGFTLLIDRIDEAWKGTDESVILLMALMHACVEINAADCPARALLFLRENIFERVRQIDNEFSRLETAVVPLDWTCEQLQELVERRLNLPFSTKLPLGGPTWDYFFESNDTIDSQEIVFDFCQSRPRDVLIYCNLAISCAQSHSHEKIHIDDLHEARRRFSDSRLKDLGDEYSENYPNIGQVLQKFYGLGREFSIKGIADFLKKLLLDEEIKELCNSWIFLHITPDLLVSLLYDIGFVGLRKGTNVIFRSLGPSHSTTPPVSKDAIVSIHPTYWEALNLQDQVIVKLEDDVPLRNAGLLSDLPSETTLLGYREQLKQSQEDLKSLPAGRESASQFEDIVGTIVKLCFFRSLANVQPKERNVDGIVIRDWIAANRASSGFWRMIRERYEATQIVWECKNFEELGADAFHQASYYMTKEIGRFVVIAFRGKETKKHYFKHIQRVANDKGGGIILLVNERDLMVFLRQAINGKVKEEHIYELYDRSVREIS